MSNDEHKETAGAPRLLVVDDNEDNRYTLILRLELEGYQDIAVAGDGEAALEMLRSREFDLMLLDVMMPKLDGYQVLERLKAEGRLHNIPVIMISALNETDSVVRCIELGAVDYLAKPFDPVLLKARVGASLEKKRLRDEVKAHLVRLEEELESARQLQKSMVPTVFPPPTRERPIEMFARMEPAREVGGDLYDFFDAENGTLCFLVGDVSGKGVPAALHMARTKNLVRLISRLARSAAGDALEPGDILNMVNLELCQDNAGMMFVTLFLCMLEPQTGKLRFCNAGHNPPYRLDHDIVEPVMLGKGRPLGLRGNSTYETACLTLREGETLYLYSDGVTEATNGSGELFAEARLEAVLRAAAGNGTRMIVEAVGDAVRSFVGNAPQSDDITAMAVRIVGPGEQT